MTRRLLLLATALIALNAQNAQAEGALPKAMLGGWCATGHTTDAADTWSSSTYRRSSRRACGEGDWLQLGARGYVEQVGEPVTCRFVSVRSMWTRGGAQWHAITARCQAEEADWYDEELMFSLAGRVLTGSVKLRPH